MERRALVMIILTVVDRNLFLYVERLNFSWWYSHYRDNASFAGGVGQISNGEVL